ncbi:FAD-binding oxidoreductase [Jiella sp. MQZ9-1]|uniref:FAD-binding oxidoreductase n=1 Tax=Jiella flava TaxID=2816857 RepID=A0A939FYS7_9HYPH|nr:FAD-binding oxidoreductase [Jiella flava]MBO0663972.1 FAD-binding oxidoreductase [Jiella flava]MCD2472543.1 FAD-binding oxidoreductase [Jiella flava]
MLNDPTSHGLWERTAPAAPITTMLREQREADVVVVGAGYTGLSAALHLAGRGLSVVVLEAAEIGYGGSGRNVGLVNAGLWMMPEDLPAILGPTYGNRLLGLLGDAPRQVFELIEHYKIDCEPVKNGTLHCGIGGKGAKNLAERARQWQALGAPVELLDAAETARKTGSPVYSAGLIDHRAGTIQPLGYARGLAAAALKAGAEIYTSSPVTGSRREGRNWSVSTPHGAVSAAWVLVATNAYTVAPWSTIREEIVHLPYFNIATKPLSSNLAHSVLPERQGCWDTKDVLTSVRFDRHDRLILGSVGALRGAGTVIHRRWARRTLRHLFPQLAAVEFEAEWYGTIGMTADAVPKLHKYGERVLSVSGYNGRGIGPGTVFGKAIARHIAGEIGEEELPLPVTEPSAVKFRFARQSFYEIGSQIAHFFSRI